MLRYIRADLKCKPTSDRLLDAFPLNRFLREIEAESGWRHLPPSRIDPLQ